MVTPGAKTFTGIPKLENEARASLISLAPTVKAVRARAGEKRLASTLEFQQRRPHGQGGRM